MPFNLDTVDVRNIRRFAVDYYMGALLAIDSLKNYGVKCDFYFYDYESQMNPFDSILKREELVNSDLIFLMSIPLLGLYELSIGVSWLVNRKKLG